MSKKYGADHVAQIVTFGTLATKMSLRDTARVFGYSPAEAAKWSSAVPNQLGIRLTEAYELSSAFRKLADSSPENKLLFETAKKIEGVPRHTSTHAAGVVISDRSLIELVPLQERKNDLSLTQYPMGNIEEIGLLKMDFLGLKNLTILNNAVQLAEKESQQKIDVFSFSMNDEKTMQLFQRADTNGIFQFESPGIKNVLRKLGPESMEDIAAVNALYRPGPMEQINTFIDRKKGKLKIEYLHPDLEDILSVTYGVMVYQEQVMQVASRMAGFTLGEADILRRAIGKKQKEAMDKERAHFIEGAVQKGYTLEKSKEVYDYIERFANYGFNRSHSVAYSYIAYQMAYMKTHYPAAFFAALLNSVNPHSDKMKEYSMDIRKRNLSFDYPDINTSSWNFSLINQNIQFGLNAIKGLRRDFIQDILSERKNSGPYKDFVQFLRRIPEKWVKLEMITPLILSGVFDKFGYNRATLLQSLPGIVSSIQYSGNNIDLFDVLEPKYIFRDELSSNDLMESEEEYLGYSLTGHPIDAYSFLYKEDEIKYIGELTTGRNLTTMGLLKEIKKIQTKKGEPMAFLLLTDSTGLLNVTIFPEQYLKFMKLLKEGTLLTISGKMENSKQYDRPTFILQKMTSVEQYIKIKEEKKKTYYIRITGENNPSDQFDKMQKILLGSPGEHPVIVYDKIRSKKILLDKKYWVDSSEIVIQKLIELFGNKNIIFK
ncbi:DNA polymerase III subunit alpha [Jeotgalibaca sp. MA1X17-3]|nr:DNA polymerase III subunit alpha [Jeotgalibaca sp. MA1X17-3]UJF14859.1 DNA polymerase III subunit alpha [Jeotgalibaca sp. MA1X17-3]